MCVSALAADGLILGPYHAWSTHEEIECENRGAQSCKRYYTSHRTLRGGTTRRPAHRVQSTAVEMVHALLENFRERVRFLEWVGLGCVLGLGGVASGKDGMCVGCGMIWDGVWDGDGEG